jgi:agmatinase
VGIPVLLGIAYDLASSFERGPAEAPPVIRAALTSESTNWWTESLKNLADPGILEDAGDLAPGAATVREEIEHAVRALLRRGRTPILLGGDHSITYPAVRAFHERGPFAVLHFDAHPDLYPEFQGDRFSHACPFARIMEEGLAAELVQVGIRTMNGVQAGQVERYGVKTVSPAEWEGGWSLASDLPVYLSIDLDVLDPAFAPGVSHPEPGGCSTRLLLSTIQRIRNPIIGADLVELNPRKDPAGLTARVAAKLVKEVAAVMLNSGAG